MSPKISIDRKKIADFCKQNHIRKLSLFGSVLRDDFRPDSDVDILVEVDGPATFDRYMKLKAFLEDLLECPIDLLTRRGIRPELAPSIEHEAVYVT